MRHQGIFLCFVGPAGSGKTTMVKTILDRYPKSTKFSVSATTRAPRENEVDGIDYHFFSNKQFSDYIKEGKFYEYEEVHGNFYGTLQSEIDECLSNLIDLLLDIDISGALNFKKQFPDRTIIVFTVPTELSQMRQRLLARGSTEEDIAKRVLTARKELEMFKKNKDLIDYFLINSDLEKSKDKALSILRAESFRLKRLPEKDILDLCNLD